MRVLVRRPSDVFVPEAASEISPDSGWRVQRCAAPVLAAARGDVSFPRRYVASNAGAYEFLETSGIVDITGLEFIHKDAHAMGGYMGVVDALCHVGHPGEMFTSAAPQDPLFWPVHGLAERYVQLLRTWSRAGNITLDETWDYDHMTGVLSDTRLVCDWEDVDRSSRDLPSCTSGVTCSGHREDDALPFAYPLGETTPDAQEYYTNGEFYELMAPWNSDLDYVYDKLTTWPACEGGVLTSS